MTLPLLPPMDGVEGDIRERAQRLAVVVEEGGENAEDKIRKQRLEELVNMTEGKGNKPGKKEK